MTNNRITNVKLDDRILELLQSNPCISKTELAATLGVARATCAKALDRLNLAGSIVGTGFVLGLPTDKTLPDVEGFVLISRPYDHEDQSKLEAVFTKNANIGQAHMITGGQFNYHFSFFVPTKSPEFVGFIEEVMRLAKTETHTVVKLLR